MQKTINYHKCFQTHETVITIVRDVTYSEEITFFQVASSQVQFLQIVWEVDLKTFTLYTGWIKLSV